MRTGPIYRTAKLTGQRCLDSDYHGDLGYSGPRERILRRRDRFRDNGEAKRWAMQQPWWDRVVDWGCDARWWAWFVRPEGGE